MGFAILFMNFLGSIPTGKLVQKNHHCPCSGKHPPPNRDQIYYVGGRGGWFYCKLWYCHIKCPYYDFLKLYLGRNSSWTPYQSRTATNIQFGQRLCQKLRGQTEIFTGNIQSSGNFVSAVEDCNGT